MSEKAGYPIYYNAPLSINVSFKQTDTYCHGVWDRQAISINLCSLPSYDDIEKAQDAIKGQESKPLFCSRHREYEKNLQQAALEAVLNQRDTAEPSEITDALFYTDDDGISCITEQLQTFGGIDMKMMHISDTSPGQYQLALPPNGLENMSCPSKLKMLAISALNNKTYPPMICWIEH